MNTIYYLLSSALIFFPCFALASFDSVAVEAVDYWDDVVLADVINFLPYLMAIFLIYKASFWAVSFLIRRFNLL